MKFIAYILLVLTTNFYGYAETDLPQKPLFLGIIIQDDDQLIPFFLRSIENLEYNKKLITLQINTCNKTETVKNFLISWINKNKPLYKEILFTDASQQIVEGDQLGKNNTLATIKDGFLAQTKTFACDHCFIVSSDIFLAPGVLNTLIQKNKPIIAPLLRPIPETNDPFRNFFADASEDGYYKDHPDYTPIANRQKLGTFKVPCVQGAYLIQTQHIDNLSFSKNPSYWEFVTFSNNARKNNVDQYICNEKEFGSFLHFNRAMTKEEEKAFTLAGLEREINPSILKSLFAPYYTVEPPLKEYIDHFNFKEYAIYRVQNRDLYYVDEVNDYIKNYIIKQGSNFEEHFQELFKKHVKPGSIALDIGGHIGTHSLYLSRIVGDKGQVHVFEPQKKIFCELVINMHLNNCANVKSYHNALGAEEKWIEMFIPEEEWTKNYSNVLNEGHGTVTEISENTNGDRAKMLKLDNFNFNNLSFIKMDVEGFEMEVIKGGLETIKRNKPVMIIEIFQNDEKMKKLETLENLGYVYSSLGKDDYLFIQKERLGLNDLPTPKSNLKIENPISVVWEGSFLDLGSLSHVNRAFISQLTKAPEIKLSSINTSHTPALLTTPEQKAVAPLLSKISPNDTKITIRHAWPPSWIPPSKGKWVLMQPWEFGALPEEWVKNLPRVDEVWVYTKYVKRVYTDSGIPANKVFVIPLGINPLKFHPEVEPYKLATNKKFKFLYLGGTIPRKGADILLKSYLKTFTAADDVCLVIKDVGSKTHYANQTYQAEIRAAQAKPNAPEIIYIDTDMSESGIASLYTACNCLVHPYRGEGFALPVLEAMASGLPVIVTAGGSTDDFVTSDYGWFIPATKQSIGSTLGAQKLTHEGWLLEPDIDALSMQMRWVAKHPEEARTKGILASDHVRKEWTWEKAAAVIVERLKRLSE